MGWLESRLALLDIHARRGSGDRGVEGWSISVVSWLCGADAELPGCNDVALAPSVQGSVGLSRRVAAMQPFSARDVTSSSLAVSLDRWAYRGPTARTLNRTVDIGDGTGRTGMLRCRDSPAFAWPSDRIGPSVDVKVNLVLPRIRHAYLRWW